MKAPKPIEQLLKSEIYVKQIGKIAISKSKAGSTLDEVEFKKELFSLITPLEMSSSNDFNKRNIEIWICHSNLFEPIKEGCLIPSYQVCIDRLEDGEICITEISKIE
jgi:hypothetical protein